MRVIFHPREPSACTFYRLLEPARHFTRHPGVEDCLLDLGLQLPNSTWNILIVQRNNRVEEKLWIGEWQSHGVKVVYDLDDDILSVPDWTEPKIREFWQDPKHVDMALSCISQSNAVTVSTEALAEVLRSYNSRVYVLKNRINPDHFIVKEPIERDTIVVGWCGSATHYADLMSMRDIIQDLLVKRPNLIFRFLGYCPPALQMLGPKIQLFTNGPLSFFPMNQYPSRIRELDFDIAICPVVNNAFNRSKSNIKWLEMASSGIPVVASAGVCYDSIRDGETGFLANSREQWLDKIGALADDVGLRRKIQRQALEEVNKNYHIKDDKYDRHQVYKEIIQ